MPVRGGAFQRIGSAKLMATGTSVLPEVPCVLAGMQRGSSDRSHHKGGATGASRICAVPLQPSAESCSHGQSAAPTDAASSNSIAATARTWRRVLMKAKSKCTALMGACKTSCKKLWSRKRRQGVKPGVVMSDSGRGESTVWCSVSPPVAHGVNAGSGGSIPSRRQVGQLRPETLGLFPSTGVRGPRSQEPVPARVQRRRGFEGTTAGSRGSRGLDRCR